MRNYGALVRHPGNAGLFSAVEMSVVSAMAGRPLHLHAEGLRGTGKTTILRAARDVLPRIERIKGCVYNCRPDRPHCPLHSNLSQDKIVALGTETVPMPFFEISHSAKVGTVVGSIDLAALTDRSHPVAALLPGTLPRAHRGVIFVDEINRLADTSPDLADVLLDAMGTKPGRVQIEEAGLPLVELPVEVTVWAASNPDEDPGPLADIRRQLSDRFDLTVNMARPTRADVVAKILDMSEIATVKRENDMTQNVSVTGDVAVEDETANRPTERLSGALARLGSIRWSEAVRHALADLYVDFGLESLRAVEAMQQAASLRCALDRRADVTIGDLSAVAGFALRHRVDLGLLSRIATHLQSMETRRSPVLPELTKPGHDGSQGETRASEACPSQSTPVQAPAETARATPTAAAPVPPIPSEAAAKYASSQNTGGLGKLLSRFLGGQPTPAGGRGGSQPGEAGGSTSSGPVHGPTAGRTGAGSPRLTAPEVPPPPHRAKAIFSLGADEVIKLPEDVGRP